MNRKKDTNLSEDFGVNLSDQAHTFKEEFFRTSEIQEVIELVQTGNNVLLVGKSGCGIDYILKGVVKKISSQMGRSEHSFFQMSINDFLVNTRYTGELETRLKNIVEYFNSQNDNKSVICFPEIHLSLSAGASLTDPHGDLASRLSFILSQKQMQIIGSVTPNFLKIMKRNNQSFINHFVVIHVSQFQEDKMALVLKDYIRINNDDLSKKFSAHNLKRIVKVSERVFQLRAQPGAAIDLLNNILSRFGPKKENKFEKAFSSALTNITAIREDFFNEEKMISLDDIKEDLKKYFVGQNQAVEQMASVLIRIKANLTPQYKPAGVMFFVGPTGVGKTELAKCLALYLLGDKKSLKIYDMSEYSHHDSIFSLIGHPEDALVQASKPRGRLVNDAITEPYSIFLLDEIEKSHEKVLYLLLQVLGEGRLKDAPGDSASFLNSIIIMTSNTGFSVPGKKISNKELIAALEERFPPEFVNRIENIVVFDYLSEEEKVGIAKKELLLSFKREGILEKELQCAFEDDLVNLIVKKGFNEKYNARGIQRSIEELVIFPLANKIASKSLRKKKINISVAKGKVVFNIYG